MARVPFLKVSSQSALLPRGGFFLPFGGADMRPREKNIFRDRFEIWTLRCGDDSYLASRNPSFIACLGFGVGLSLSLPSLFSDRKTNKPTTSYTISESLQSRNSLSTILIPFFLRFTQLHHRLYKCTVGAALLLFTCNALCYLCG